jgi:hypothetical protein
MWIYMKHEIEAGGFFTGRLDLSRLTKTLRPCPQPTTGVRPGQAHARAHPARAVTLFG